MVTILLASESERRRDMMRALPESDGGNLLFGVLEEPEPEPSMSLAVNLQVEASCIHKARSAVLEFGPDEANGVEIIVVSDTLVEDPDDCLVALGKPRDKISATSTLIRLSGRRHKVWSSTAIISRNGPGMHVGLGWMAEVWTDFAIVEFDEIGVDGMGELIGTESWVGKAGGYDLAGKAGSFSRVIEGVDVTVLGFSARGFDEIRRLFL